MDALERQMRGSEYGEQDRKAAILYEYRLLKATEGEQLLDSFIFFLNNLQPEWKQYGTLMRQTKNLMDINIDALYNILKQNQGDVNEAMGHTKKSSCGYFNPLALVSEKTKSEQTQRESCISIRVLKEVMKTISKPEYVKSEEKKEDKKADEKKRDMSKVKCYNCKKEGHFAKDCKKAKVKDYNYYKTKMLLAKKDSDEKVLLAEDQA
ncbi:retrovirus-related pol polyprotein from transposon TNT 1-94 [Tanacetum coccineum]